MKNLNKILKMMINYNSKNNLKCNNIIQQKQKII